MRLLRLSRLLVLLLRPLAKAMVLLFPHFLIEMPVLLEPISIHSVPLSLHQGNDRVKPSLASQFIVLLFMIKVKPCSVIKEDGFVVWPKMVNHLIGARWIGLVGNTAYKSCDTFDPVSDQLLVELVRSIVLSDLFRRLVTRVLLFSHLIDSYPLCFSNVLFLNLVRELLFLFFELSETLIVN